MLCFRCGSPVDQDARSCPNCGQDLGDAGREAQSFTELQKQIGKGERDWARPTTYKVGELVQDRYEITDLVGTGALGVVYKVLDQEVDVEAALKVITSDFLPDEQARQRFIGRVEPLKATVHENVVRYFDVGRDGDRCYYVTQLLEGLSLRKVIDLRREKGQRFSLEEVQRICLQLCDALADTELVHGALKPENVLILRESLKVTDPCLVHALPRDAFLAAQRSSGDSYGYLAPEVRDHRDVEGPADVYAIGATLIELFTGRVFHEGMRLAKRGLTKEVEVVVERALAMQPAARIASVGELRSALKRAFGGEQTDRTTLRMAAAADPEAEPEARSTLRFGSTLPAADPGDDRPTVKLAAAARIEAKPEVTEQLSLDDVELAEPEAEHTERREQGDPDGGQPPSENTEQLSVDDVEFEEPPAASTAGDDDVTIPRATLDERRAAAEEEVGDDDIFPDTADRIEQVAETSAPVEKTEEFDPAMIVEDEPPEDAEGEQLLFPPQSQGRDYAAVSGETDSSVKALKELEEEAPLPHARRRKKGRDREARARDALQAFTPRTEDSSPAIEPADMDDHDTEVAATPGVSSSSVQGTIEPDDGVEPEVLHADAVPQPLDSTVAIERKAGEAPPRRSPMPMIVAGVGIGAAVAVVAALVLHDVKKPAPLARKAGPTPVAPPKVQPLGGGGAPERADARRPVVAPLGGGDAGTGAPAADGAAPTPADAGGPPPAVVEPKRPEPKRPEPKRPEPKRPEPKRPEPKRPEPKRPEPKRPEPKKPRPKKPQPKKPQPKKPVAGGAGKCYRGMVHVRVRGGDGYCIDRYEAPGGGRKPRRGVSLSAARAACRARGLRLCSAREWVRACGGLFPYGRRYQPGRCTTEAKAPARAGSKRRCRSRWGVYDMSGNVAEWVADGVAMGGHFGSKLGHASCTARAGGGPKTGYRCCGDPSWE